MGSDVLLPRHVAPGPDLEHLPLKAEAAQQAPS